MSSGHYIAGVELGGTTCVAAIATLSSPSSIIERLEIETTTEETLTYLAKFLKSQLTKLNVDSFSAVGIASFGPVDLNKQSKTFGFITTSPKERWRFVDVLGFFRRDLGDTTPIAFETDVNAPAMAEMAHEMTKPDQPDHPGDSRTVVYITVGTGVGVGVSINGNPVHGLIHPEGGHMVLPRMPDDDYPGCCSYNHHCCVEGMIDSKAIAERVGTNQSKLHEIADSNAVWDRVGYYLGALCLNITYLVSPHVIVLGGGIMKRTLLYSKARHWFKELLNGYLDDDKFKTPDGLASYIRESVYGNDAGIIGALELARKEAQQQ